MIGLQTEKPELDIMSRPDEYRKGVKTIRLNVYSYEFLEAYDGGKYRTRRYSKILWRYFTSQSSGLKPERQIVALDLAERPFVRWETPNDEGWE